MITWRPRLQTSVLNEALLDRRDVSLSVTQRVCRRVDRVGAEDEIVLVRRGRAENKLAVDQRLELDHFVRRLEYYEFSAPQFVRRRQDARCYGGPEDGVDLREFVTPALPGPSGVPRYS